MLDFVVAIANNSYIFWLRSSHHLALYVRHITF